MIHRLTSIRVYGLIASIAMAAAFAFAAPVPPSALADDPAEESGVVSIQSAVTLAGGYADTYVDDNFNASTPGWGVTHFAVIQDAVAATTDTGTLHVANGVYTQGFNIDTRNAIKVTGESRDGVIIMPSSDAIPPLYGWQAEGQTTARRAAVRVFKSPGVTIENLTVDMENAKRSAYRTHGIFASECNNLLIVNVCVKNNDCPDAGGFGNTYTEIGIRVSTAHPSLLGFDCSNRAVATIQDCLITDAGRIGVWGVNNVMVNVLNCRVTKDPAREDFGYGIQLGSGSSGYVYGCYLSGFGTAALSDGSGSGAYFFSPSYIAASNCSPNIVIENCEAHDSTMGVICGNNVNNTPPTYGTNTDMTVTLLNNVFDGNVYGMTFENTGASQGDSLTVNAYGNTFSGSLEVNVYVSDYHYWVAPGDGDITANFVNNTFENGNYGMYFEADDSEDGNCTYYGGTPIACGPASTYDLSFNNNNFINNAIDFVSNNNAPVDADSNWWGQEGLPGPGDIAGDNAGDVITTTVLTAPQNKDDDEDGLGNWDEDKNMNGVVDAGETDPNNPDTDGDGINDGADPDPLTPAVYTDNDNDEQAAELGDTDDNNADRDGDGFKDGYEVAVGTNPDDPNSKPTLGDSNTTGRVDNVDAVIIFAASLGQTNWDRWNYNNMDVDRNGIKNNADAIIVMNFFLDNVEALPYY